MPRAPNVRRDTRSTCLQEDLGGDRSFWCVFLCGIVVAQKTGPIFARQWCHQHVMPITQRLRRVLNTLYKSPTIHQRAATSLVYMEACRRALPQDALAERSEQQLHNMQLLVGLLAALVASLASIASAQDFSGIHEISSGPEGADVICLLLHGAAFSSADWAPGSTTNTLTVLADAGEFPSSSYIMRICVSMGVYLQFCVVDLPV